MAHEPDLADWAARQFTRRDGSFHFARWAQPMAPAFIGADPETAKIFQAATKSIGRLTGLGAIERDPELGSNFITILVTEWSDLNAVPSLGRLVSNLPLLIQTLIEQGANQYRLFNFFDDGAIRLCTVLLRTDDDLRRVPLEALALGEVLQSALLWSDAAFDGESPVVRTPDGIAVVRQDLADLLRAAYDPALPPVSKEAEFASRLADRMRSDRE